MRIRKITSSKHERMLSNKPRRFLSLQLRQRKRDSAGSICYLYRRGWYNCSRATVSADKWTGVYLDMELVHPWKIHQPTYCVALENLLQSESLTVKRLSHVIEESGFAQAQFILISLNLLFSCWWCFFTIINKLEGVFTSLHLVRWS